jgi:acetyltransferase-like isoleucine patch superfamily enzyme
VALNLKRFFSGNPHNLTSVHLAKPASRWGWQIGDHSYGAPKVRFPDAGARLTIGRFCSFADGVEIFLGGNHRWDWATTYPFSGLRGMWPEAPQTTEHHATRGDVEIGHDVWLGSGAVVLSGVRIGTGAVIAARAVVTQDVEPYGIVGGNPARLIRHRFPPDKVRKLLASKWWDLSRPDIAALIPLLQSTDIEALVAAIEVRRQGPDSASM